MAPPQNKRRCAQCQHEHDQAQTQTLAAKADYACRQQHIHFRHLHLHCLGDGQIYRTGKQAIDPGDLHSVAGRHFARQIIDDGPAQASRNNSQRSPGNAHARALLPRKQDACRNDQRHSQKNTAVEFSLNTNHDSTAVRTHSIFNSSDAAEAGVTVRPIRSSTGPAMPPERIAPPTAQPWNVGSLQVGAGGFSSALAARTANERNNPRSLPIYRNPASSTGDTCSSNLSANGVLAPNRAAARRAK